MEHRAALTALLYLPVLVLLPLAALNAAAQRGNPRARALVGAFQAAPAAAKGAALLMAITAVIHLALAPAHAGMEPITAALFGLDGIGLAAAAVAATFGHRAWRLPAGLLLGGSLAAYAYYLVAGLETADVIGLATKAVEVVALGLVAVAGPRPLFQPISRRYS